VHAQSDETENQESTESASQIDDDQIKENIRKRIEQVVNISKTQTDQKKTAFLGTLDSITPNSILLETDEGSTIQASTSASTVYINMNTNKEVSREDASIGNYIAALGFIHSDLEVLDARRLLILDAPPEVPEKTSFYGTIETITDNKSQFELKHPQNGELKLFKFNSKTSFLLSDPAGLTNQELDSDEIEAGQLALVIYEPASSSTSASLADIVLIKNQEGLESNAEPKE